MRWIAKAVIVCLCAAGVLYAAFELSRSRSFQVFGDIVSHGPAAKPQVALTLDDGPTRRYTAAILETLAAKGAVATFYLTGREMAEQPKLTAAIVAAGHEIGNHSYSHHRMVLMSPATVRHEIEETSRLIRQAGYDGPITFRPPHGKKLFVLPWVLRQMGITTVMWSLEPEDKPTPTTDPELIANRVIENAENGSIILLHAMYSSRDATRQALPAIIDGLRERGFELVTVSELMAQ